MRILPLVLLACGGKDEDGDSAPPVDTDQGGGGACGDVTTHDVQMRGLVNHASGGPAAGAEVRLEDRAWNPGTVLGTGTTDGTGAFGFDAPGVTSVEGCWGIALDYALVAVLGTAQGEIDVNSVLFDAIESGDLVADTTARPIEIE